MKFTPEQVAQMRKAAQDYAEAQSSDFQEIGQIAEERLCTLAADRAIEAAAVECGAKHANGNRKYTHADECLAAIRAMKEQA